MEALDSLYRAVGYGGWGAVLLGAACVMLAVLLGGRRQCVRLTVPVGEQREQIKRSQGYSRPPYRRGCRRR